MRGAQPPDEFDVPVRRHRLLAVVAPQARLVTVIPPTHRTLGGAMGVQQLLDVAAVLPVDRHAVRSVLTCDRAVAQVQHGLRGDRDPGGDQLVGVGRELEHGPRLHRAGQLGVHDGVAHLPRCAHLSHEEVRTTVEPAVEEATLEDHVGTGT